MAISIRKQWGEPASLTAKDLFEMACGQLGVRRSFTRPKLP
jgi:hypothetical protein